MKLNLVKELLLKNQRNRFIGSYFGGFWVIFTPIMMLAVYTFVFSEVFAARWSGQSQGKADFALLLYAGLIIYNMFAESISRAPTLMLQNPNFIKKIVFPTEILSIVNVLDVTFTGMINIFIWILFYVVVHGIPSYTALTLPLIIAPYVLLLIGLSFFVSAIGVYIRDFQQIIAVIVTFLLFMSPIFYPIDALPEIFQKIVMFNPLALVINLSRDVLFYAQLPNISLVLLLYIISIFIFWAGYRSFMHLKDGFADVL